MVTTAVRMFASGPAEPSGESIGGGDYLSRGGRGVTA